MFTSNYSVEPKPQHHSRYHQDAAMSPEASSSSHRHRLEDRHSQDHYQQQQPHLTSGRHGESYFTQDATHYSSTPPPSGSLRRKSQQDWSRPRGSPGFSPLRPTASPMQRPPPNDENAAVLDRMKAAGWVGVGSSSSMSGQGDEESMYTLSGHGSMDSGYASAYGGEEAKSAIGLGSWSALKKAVGLGEETDADISGYSTPISAPKSAQGSHYWDKLTTKLAITVNQRTDEDDDDKIGEDGETKLGRAIREYHFSRAMSVEDIPEWLFTPAELAARRTRRAPPPPSPSVRRRSTFGRRDDNEPSMAAVRAAGRKASRVPLTREGGLSRQNRMDSVDEGPTGSGHRAGSAGEGRAADKLRAMREAKRVR